MLLHVLSRTDCRAEDLFLLLLWQVSELSERLERAIDSGLEIFYPLDCLSARWISLVPGTNLRSEPIAYHSFTFVRLENWCFVFCDRRNLSRIVVFFLMSPIPVLMSSKACHSGREAV